MPNSSNISNQAVHEQQILMDYINDKLSLEERYALEEKMEENPFLADALEGLQNIRNEERIQQLSTQINLQLKHTIAQKKTRKIKVAKFPTWILSVTCIIIFFLCIIYFVFYTHRN